MFQILWSLQDLKSSENINWLSQLLLIVFLLLYFNNEIHAQESPDLFVSYYSSPLPVAPGDTAVVSYNIQNSGEQEINDGYNIELYLSHDLNLDTDDIALHSFSVLNKISKGTVHAIPSVKHFIPNNTLPGDFFILIFVDFDQRIAESNEENNISAIPLKILPLPDLVIKSEQVSSTDLWLGDSIQIGCLIRINDSHSPENIQLQYYISKDDKYDDSDTPLGALHVYKPINVATDYAIVEKKYLIPENFSLGNFYILLFIDPSNNILESDEGNNISKVPISITSRPRVTLQKISDKAITDKEFILNATIDSYYPVASVVFSYQGIMDTSVHGSKEYFGEGPFKISIPAHHMKDSIGYEYSIFVVDSMGIKSEIYSSFVNTYYPFPGLAIPYNSFGPEAVNYRILSIPLDLDSSSIGSVFFDSQGEYNKKKWRILQYSNGANLEFKNGIDNIEPGKGYWFTAAENSGKTIYTGSGIFSEINTKNLFKITLAEGWNQIGNPYPFSISIDEVRKFEKNDSSSLVSWKKWNGSWTSQPVLNAFEGGFLFASKPVTIYFPLKKTDAFSQRIGFDPDAKMDKGNWECSLLLTGDRNHYKLSGIGMRKDASISIDKFDDLTPPRFGDWMEVNFHHPEYLYSSFTKDVVPSGDTNVWNLEVKTFTAGMKSISWDSSCATGNLNQLRLYDIESDKVIYMDKQSSYEFKIHDSKKFKIFYGPEYFLESNLKPYKVSFGKAYPNPISESMSYYFSIPHSDELYKADINISTVTGRIIYNTTYLGLKEGYYNYDWNREKSDGSRVEAGVYFYKVKITTSSNHYEYVQKILLQ